MPASDSSSQNSSAMGAGIWISLRILFYALFIVCPLLFFTDLTRNPYYTQIALLNIFMCACWLLILWDAWNRQEFLLVTTSFDTPLVALIVISFLTWMISFIEHPALVKPIYSEGSKAAIFLILNTYLVYKLAMQ